MGIKFEKFYLVDFRGKNGNIILRFIHIENGKKIKCNTHEIIGILQSSEIQIQTKFSTEKTLTIIKDSRNLRNINIGDPINIYYIPVSISENSKFYYLNY
jgi:hypothetical protein